MEVTLNHVAGRLSVRSHCVDVVPHPGVSLPSQDNVLPTLAFSTVLQILVSRKRPTQVRVMRNSALPPWDLVFQSTQDRDTFVNAVSAASTTGGSAVKSEGQGGADAPLQSSAHHDAEVATAASIGDTHRMALGAGAISELRGAVHVFEAINVLIEPSTLQLRAITEQMESDILRQLPALAQVYGARVESEEDRRAFWEAVVRKYFCFSRSFLDVELPKKVDVGAPTAKLEANINMAASVALPVAAEQQTTTSNLFVDALDDAFRFDDGGDGTADVVRRRALLPMVSWRKRPRCSGGVDAADAERTAPRCSASVNAVRLPDVSIQFQVPESARNDKVLRQLKSFWTNVANGAPTDGPRKALEGMVGALANDSVMHRCATAAIHHGEQCGSGNLSS